MFTPAPRHRHLFPLLFALLACRLLVPPSAEAQFQAWVLATLPDTPEGLAVDAGGNLYATLYHSGEVVRIGKDGAYRHIAWVPSEQEHGRGTLTGIAADRAGNLYVAYKDHSRYDAEDLVNPMHPACRDATATRTGLYKIDAATHQVTPLATKASGWPFCFPDDVAIDSHGNIYMTDLTYSAIWKISPDGNEVDLWSADRLLNWPPDPYSGFPLGVNDIAIDKDERRLFAVTDGDPMLLSIGIGSDGSASVPHILGPGGYSILDGIEIDGRGHIFISDVARSEIWAVSRDGAERVLIASKRNAPLDDNTSLVFWHDPVRGEVLCTANLGYSHWKTEEAARTIVCMKGFPLPQ